MIKDTTLRLSPPAEKVERLLFCTGSHHPPALCGSLATAAFLDANYRNIICPLCPDCKGEFFSAFALVQNICSKETLIKSPFPQNLRWMRTNLQRFCCFAAQIRRGETL
jgi:hypothetical protein